MNIHFLQTGPMGRCFLALGPSGKVEGNDTSPVASAAPDLEVEVAVDTGPLGVETAD